MTTRAQVDAALLSLLQPLTFPALANGGATTWVTGPSDPNNVGKPAKLRLFSDVTPDQQPACFMTTHREMSEYRGLSLLRTRLEKLLYIYSRSDAVSGGPDLDLMFEAVQSIFINGDNNSSGQLTLGGLVYWARIEGRVFHDPGDLDNQTLLIIPISVEMP